MHRLLPLLVLVCAARAPLLGEESLASRVNRAIDRGAANLLSRQEEDGAWQSSDAVHPLGRTALCAFALLHAGVSPGHAAIERAVGRLGFDAPVVPKSTYEAGCMLLLLHALGPRFRARTMEICDWLVAHFRDGAKMWGYPDGVADLSNTQFAVFGLKVGELQGHKAPRDLWQTLVKGVLALQHKEGAFRYKSDDLYRASMTHAALLTLRLAGESLGQARPPREVATAIARGQGWLEKHYRVDLTPWGRGWHTGYYFYYMYGLARYGEIFGLKEIAGHDWYREGAEELLARQEKSGSWGTLDDTSFAILFLRRVTFTAPRVQGKGEGEREREREREGGAGADAGDQGDPAPARPAPEADLPFLREWLVAGPFAGERYEDDMLFTEHFAVSRASPAVGSLAGKRKWTKYLSPTDELDLKEACGPADWATAYAALWLHTKEATEATLWVGSDDGFLLWCNGEQVCEGHHHDHSGADHYRIDLKLKAGANLLLFRLENLGHNWILQARLGRGGEPHPGVVVSTRRRM